MAPTNQRPQVYLAGPGVFRPDPLAFGQTLKEKCAQAGLVGLFPMDNQISDNSPHEKGASIYRANVELIDRSRAIIADISPFRGPSMDPGTAWEIGYGIARGLPVFAWTDDPAPLLERTRWLSAGDVGSVDANGWTIEDFGHAENLMIAVSATAVLQSADAAIAACAAALRKSPA
jgi:nucleoside 2-deoxyribosyltransferase